MKRLYEATHRGFYGTASCLLEADTLPGARERRYRVSVLVDGGMYLDGGQLTAMLGGLHAALERDRRDVEQAEADGLTRA